MAKSYYILIQTGREITSETRYFRVSVGTSIYERNYLHSIRGMCEKRGYYFKQIDNTSWDFVAKCLKSVYGYCDMVLVAACLYDVSAFDMVEILEGRKGLPDTSRAVANASRALCSMSVDYRVCQKMGEKLPKNLRGGSPTKYGKTYKQAPKRI